MRVHHFDQSPAVTHHYARNDPLFVPSCPVLGGGRGAAKKLKLTTLTDCCVRFFYENTESDFFHLRRYYAKNLVTYIANVQTG